MNPTSNPNIRIETLRIQDLKPDPKNTRLHSKKQIDVLARAIHSLGFNNPVLIDKNNVIIAGHGRLEAAKKLALITVPVIRLEHLTPEQVRAYRIADNRIAELAEWDENALRIELQDLSLLDLDFDLSITGFETAEIDLMIMPPDTDAIPEPPIYRLIRENLLLPNLATFGFWGTIKYSVVIPLTRKSMLSCWRTKKQILSLQTRRITCLFMAMC